MGRLYSLRVMVTVDLRVSDTYETEAAMAHFEIDLVNGDDVITFPKEEDPKEVARREAMRKKALEDIFRRAPRPQLEIVPAVPIEKR